MTSYSLAEWIIEHDQLMDLYDNARSRPQAAAESERITRSISRAKLNYGDEEVAAALAGLIVSRMDRVVS
tara:strand:- start:1921 stop:2130 length:210 start_codon:yes stop_codon:yes gene_type:complete